MVIVYKSDGPFLSFQDLKCLVQYSDIHIYRINKSMRYNKFAKKLV